MLRLLVATIVVVSWAEVDRAGVQQLLAASSTSVLVGKEAYGDWRSDDPGVRRHIRDSDLPPPYASDWWGTARLSSGSLLVLN